MGYNFFAYLGRMKYIERWSLMRSVTRENIMEHTADVSILAHALAVIHNKNFGGNLDAAKVAALALFHDSVEVITGDLPMPVKYYNNDIKDAYKNLEGIAAEKLLSMLPDELRGEYKNLLEPNVNSYEYKIIKAADTLSAYIKCIEECKSGNNEFKKALSSSEKLIKGYKMPEVEFFLNNFIPGYRLTLDELD